MKETSAERTGVLWAGLLTGPIVWLLALEIKFALAPWICTYQWKPATYAVSAICLAITATAGMLSWSEWKQLRSKGEDAVSRPCAMAMGGAMLSAGFIIVLIAQALPELILRGCE